MIQQKASILANEEVAADIFLMEIHSPQLVALGRPGQFLHLRVGQTDGIFLRRPLSLFSRDQEGGVVGLLFRRVGRGTQLLSLMKPGESLDLLGPLGRAFSLTPDVKTAILVAGGLGVAPLFWLSQELIEKGIGVRFLLGARVKELLLCVHRLRAMGADLMVSTNDGSEGFHGLVTELLEDILNRERLEPRSYCLYATGPQPMMEKIAHLARNHQLAAQFSLERHMACGVGACLGCVVRCRDKDGGLVFRRVCRDGPVFHLQEVLW